MDKTIASADEAAALVPDGATIWDYACAENNRNPVTATGQTLTLDAEGKVLDRDR